MFCGECGTKNKKGAALCEECGAKLETEEEKEEKVEKKTTKNVSKEEKEEIQEETKREEKEKKPLTKKQKTLCIIGAIALVVLFGGYKYLEKQTSPKTIVENYLKAVNANDYKKLYKYSNYEGDKTFITEKQFEEAIKEQNKDSKAGNYVVGNVTLENAGLEANVTVNTTEKKELTIKLSKGMKKKYLFFDNWSITDAKAFGIDTVKDYKIKVPKGTEVTFAGVKVADKYISKEEKKDESQIVTYVLPQVFATKTQAKMTLSKTSVEREITPSNYSNYYTLSFKEEEMNEKDKEAILDATKSITNALMKGIIDKKDYKDIKEAADLAEGMKSTYETKLNSYKRTNKSLEKFEITSAEITNITMDSDYMKVRVYLKYKYSTTTYKDREYTSSIYYSVGYDKGFKVFNLNGLPYTSTY